jgi:predicted flap endonuclease-1-like 5' DNA nuclease
MKKDDLTQVKHVGAARMKLLNDSGITTIKQLYEASVEELTRIEGFGEHYAKLIKDAAAGCYRPTPKPVAAKTASDKEKKIEAINANLRKQVKILKKRLKRTNENLKPLGKKKYLQSYLELKKRSKMLKTRLKALDQSQEDLSGKEKKKISKRAAALNSALKITGKKPTKKNYKKVIAEIQSFSNML